MGNIGRRRAEYLDERILEYLDEEGWATPSIMARNPAFTASEGHIRERCRKLRYIGFIDVIHGRMYEIDRDGQLYLEGKVDARYRPKPTVTGHYGEQFSKNSDFND